MEGVCKLVDSEELRALLEASLKLMSQYARELNNRDNGHRKEYQSIEQWKVDAIIQPNS